MNVKKMMLFALDFEILGGTLAVTGSFRTYVACKDAKSALEMAEKTEVEDKPGSTLRFVGMLSVAPLVVEMPGEAEKAPLNPNHMRRLVGHPNGTEQTDVCICGKPWPCAEGPDDRDFDRHYPPGWAR